MQPIQEKSVYARKIPGFTPVVLRPNGCTGNAHSFFTKFSQILNRSRLFFKDQNVGETLNLKAKTAV
jgi:hypothetical protein